MPEPFAGDAHGPAVAENSYRGLNLQPHDSKKARTSSVRNPDPVVAPPEIRQAEDIAPSRRSRPRRTHFMSRSINSLLPTARESSRLHLASGCRRSSVPAILSKLGRSCPTDQTTRIFSGTRQTMWTRFCAALSPARAADQVRACHQSHDRQGAWADDSRIVPAARRRGDRIAFICAALHASAFGLKRTCRAGAAVAERQSYIPRRQVISTHIPRLLVRAQIPKATTGTTLP